MDEHTLSELIRVRSGCFPASVLVKGAGYAFVECPDPDTAEKIKASLNEKVNWEAQNTRPLRKFMRSMRARKNMICYDHEFNEPIGMRLSTEKKHESRITCAL
ncbi:hypothetical protein AVEN_93435-1 [Araneus ventricosus]|uniref:Uncharacterized protein n=1 Tax=Araneus ventricosus TaxID=182803 RepID=A0A4Y2APF6_ARAVE|nr:hypothetical protein AVEN_93435-1 [Araneus ventricosus]